MLLEVIWMLVLCLILSTRCILCNLIQEYVERPRIELVDGHMLFVAAEDRSIKLITGVGGTIYLNEEDLTQLTRSAREAADTVQALKGGTLAVLERNVRGLQEAVTGSLGVAPRLTSLEQMLANSSSNVEKPANIQTRLRTLSQKVRTLSIQLRNLQTQLKNNECTSNPCRNGGTCEDTFNGFICRCPSNWQGTLCDADVNECAHFAGTDLGCQNGATCINGPGSYQCTCAPGFFGIHCTRRSNSCGSAGSLELCGHGVCVEQGSGYRCICDQGWTTDGASPACTRDVDECTGRVACSQSPPVPCINVPGSFYCGACPQGYTGNGYYCSDIDECQMDNGGCSTNPRVQCINTMGSRMCGLCPPGYRGDGVSCTFVGVCQLNNGGCHPLAQCTESPGISQSYVRCVCPAGYVGSGMGPVGCMPGGGGGGAVPGGRASPCEPNPCLHGACTTTGAAFTCSCLPGYTGPTCNIQADPCASSPCQNGGTCVAQGAGYVCRCSQQATGPNCEQEQLSCGGILRSAGGSLRFPPAGARVNYPPNMSCAWVIISTNSSKVINVTFSNFHLEQSSECTYDWLQIHDGRSAGEHLLGRYCGSALPNNGRIISTHNVLYLWFRSDHSDHDNGFELTWNSIDPVCGGPITFESHGSLSSPGYPGKYPQNRDCVWELIAPFGMRIQLNFFTLNIENHLNCSFDFLEISDGNSNQVLETFCNSSHPPQITTSGRRAFIRFHSDNVSRDSGFQISYSAVSGYDCGGILTSPSGTIQSPIQSDTGRYRHGVTCEWVIRYPYGERVQLAFQSFALEQNTLCRFDKLEIHEGQRPSLSLARRYCGTKLPAPYLSNGNVITVIFRSDTSISDEGFIINYNAVCGGKFTVAAGNIMSPMYPSKYPNNKDCIYELQQPPGKSIVLTFVDFELESWRGINFNGVRRCYDYVEIHDGFDGRAPLMGTKYCGQEVPPPIISTHNYLWIKFHSDSSVQKRGFLANYTAQDITCGGILRDQDGTIQSPHYPNPYSYNHMCQWIIVAEEGSVITLHWESFHLEDSGCRFDYVHVFDNVTGYGNGTSMKRFCGSQIPPDLTSTSNIVTLIFKSDRSLTFPGFVVRYTQVPAAHICGGNYFSEIGTLVSPGYPQYYPSNKDCTWVITVEEGQQILLNVTDFSLEYQGNCNWDFLEIRNGGYETSPPIGKYCGGNIPPQIASHSNQLFIRFKTDYSRTDRGFNISWDGTITGCGGILRGKSGHITSPNYPQPYGRSADCIYKVSTSRGSIVQVVFLDFDLESSNGCIFDHLIFYDGLDASGTSNGPYCGSMHPAFVRSKSNNMLIRFRSDASDGGRGFSIKYDTVCDTTITGFSGVIESPNFPNPYPNHVSCKWKIKVPKGNFVNITFSHFLMEGGSCRSDYVEIKEAFQEEEAFTSLTGKLCGNQLPPRVNSHMNTVSVEMKTDYSVVHSGFRLEWFLFGCGGLLTKPNGEFTSPGYPTGYPDEVQCEWSISVDLGLSIELSLHDVHMEPSTRCIMDVIAVYGGPDADSPKLNDKLCQGFSQPILLTSSGNNMFIKFSSDVSNSGRGFSASYRTIMSECGGRFVSPSGYIHSHNYPNNYDPNDDCIWYIEVEKNHVVKLTFLSFDLEHHNNCSYDYVKVFDGNSTDSPELATLCGNSLPNNSFITTGNTMVVRMKADGSMSYPGFTANYSTVCGARIVTEESGIIALTEAINSNPDNQNCTWIISGTQPQDRVTLIVTHMDLSFSGDNTARECDFAYLEVRDGAELASPLVGAYCGSRAPPPITSHGSALLLRMVSVYNSHHYGFFSAAYSVARSFCGGNLTSEEGAIASPGYPDNYPLNIECVWTLAASPGNRAMLSFRSFNLEQSDNCNKDYLEVRESSAAGRLIGVYCSDLPTNITASQMLWIKFRSNEDNTGSGFVADYSLLHGNELSGAMGSLASPLYPRPYMQAADYRWRISVEAGFAIRISFTAFFIESYTSACEYHVAVFDGYDDTGPLLMKRCGGVVPEPVTSSANVVYVVLNSVALGHGSLFFLDWMQVERASPAQTTAVLVPGCGGLIYLAPNSTNDTLGRYVLTSPGFPHGYGHGLECTWVVQTPPEYHVLMTVDTMDLEETPRCNLDSLSVFEGEQGTDSWKLVKTLCRSNSSAEPPIEGSSRTSLLFKTDYSVNRTGFSVTLQPACGGSIEASDGVIDVDNTTVEANILYYRIECKWNITVRSGRTIHVQIERFNIVTDSTSQCNRNYLKLRNGHYEDSPTLGNTAYCGNTIPIIPESSSNRISIVYVNTRRARGMRLRFSEVAVGCGGSSRLEGAGSSLIVESPNFPASAPSFIECTWTVIAPGDEALQVDFDEHFDFDITPECEEHYVELRDGATPLAPLLGRFCRSRPSTQKSVGNVLSIMYRQGRTQRNGFRANVTLARCGGTLYAGRGQLLSPGYPRPYPAGSSCSWRIPRQDYRSVRLSFRDLDLPPGLRPDQCGPDGCADPCSRADHVTVSEVMVGGAPARLVQTVCGGDAAAVAPIEVVGVAAEVAFRPGPASAGQHRGFHINFTQTPMQCGEELRGDSGEITSPNYPAVAYNLYCMWKIFAPQGRRVTVNIVDSYFDTNSGSYTNLRFFSDSYGYQMASIKSNSSLRVTESTGSVMQIAYHTAHDGSRFKLLYTTHQPIMCGGLLEAAGSISWSPPGNSTFYCEWERGSQMNGTLALIFINTTVSNKLNRLCTYRASVIKIINSESDIVFICENSTRPTMFLTPHPGAMLVVHFTAFDLGSDCSKTFLNVHNGQTAQSPLIQSLCRATIPPDIRSGSHFLWIEFHSLQFSAGTGFSLTTSTVTNGCGGIFHEQTKSVSSPNFPHNYPPNVECEWEIRLETGFIVDLSFIERFDLEKTSDCTNDFVEIYDYRDNEYVLLKRLCGKDIEPPINSTTNQMKIRFKSNGAIQGDGFKAQWVSRCGGTIENVTQGYLFSPNYPKSYPDFQFCNYTVLMPGHIIRTRFETFDLEEGRVCRYDNVTLEGNQGTVGPYCGKNVPPPSVFRDQFSLFFRSDPYIVGTGFMLHFWSNNECGGAISTPGTLVSPNTFIPLLYSSINCTWVITAPEDYVVTVRFASLFTMAAYMTCIPTDHGLSVYDGLYVDESNRRQVYCGNLTRNPPVVSSRGRSMVLQYMTYTYRNDDNFRADILFTYGENVGCGGWINVTHSSQTIISPDIHHNNHYENSLDCKWTLSAIEGKVLRLEVSSLDLQPCMNLTSNSSQFCSCDYLEVRDGGGQYSELVGRYCGSFAPATIFSSGSQLWLRLVTDDTGTGRGFRARVQAQAPYCGDTTLNVTTQVQQLTSPNYPQNYPVNVRCSWLLTGQLFKKVAVHIEDLDIPAGSPDCSNSMLKITDTSASDIISEGMGQNVVVFGHTAYTRPLSMEYGMSEPLSSYTFCGQTDPFNYYSNAREVSVMFSANQNVAKGFRLTYSEAGCSRNYSAEQGRVRVQGEVQQCVMTISALPNRTLALYFTRFFVSHDDDCSDSGMEVREGGPAGLLLASLCGSALPSPLFSHGAALWLRLFHQQGYHTEVDFTYTSTDQGRGCGGRLFNYGGTFSSPLYPANYRNASVCRWDVAVPTGHLVALKFREFDLGAANTCGTDYVEVLEDEAVQARYCGGDSPAAYVGAGSRLSLRYTSSVHNGGSGWVAVFVAQAPGQPLAEGWGRY